MRGWLRRAELGAEQLRRRATALLHQFTVSPPMLEPTGSVLGDALTALAAMAVAAVVRCNAGGVRLWHVAAVLAAPILPVARSS
ncbi:hypothetical protein [Acrocarpospora corrugata]|uniref:hypothetical protein n=1 Tax=Acrocarpospora corrugata TaxID=35763 RepID=UPI0015816711|nr:hypothetical protein [Acrocarpospora corrugata]